MRSGVRKYIGYSWHCGECGAGPDGGPIEETRGQATRDWTEHRDNECEFRKNGRPTRRADGAADA